MTNQSSADSFLPQIEEKLLAINETEQAMEEIDKTKGPRCSERLGHAIDCGKLLDLAKESCKTEKLIWRSWLKDHFGSRLGYSTAELWIKLGKAEEFLSEQMNLVANKRMSLRQAVQLIPLTEKGMERSTKAKAKSEKNKTEKAVAEKAKAIEEAKATMSTEDRVGDLALDEVLLAKTNVDVGEIYMALTSTLDSDQLLDLTTRLESFLDKQQTEEQSTEEQATEPPRISTEELRRRVERFEERQQPTRRA